MYIEQCRQTSLSAEKSHWQLISILICQIHSNLNGSRWFIQNTNTISIKHKSKQSNKCLFFVFFSVFSYVCCYFEWVFDIWANRLSLTKLIWDTWRKQPSDDRCAVKETEMKSCSMQCFALCRCEAYVCVSEERCIQTERFACFGFVMFCFVLFLTCWNQTRPTVFKSISK